MRMQTMASLRNSPGWARHVPLVLLVEHDRDQAGRPVVAVDDVRPLAGLALNSTAAREKNANRSGSSPYPYSRSRPKKLAPHAAQ